MNKNKKGNSIYVYIILFIIFLFLLIFIYGFVKEKEKKPIKEDEANMELALNEDIVVEGVNPFDEEKSIKVVINNDEYTLKLENNIAAYDLVSILPISIKMDDLNNNEKYSYLNLSLNNLDDYTGKISKGDVMLYQSNCIVIFYKDIDTSYKYTKIGHIDNLPNFNSDSIDVSFN